MGELTTAVSALGVAVAARVPVLLWGPPGTGKTATVRALGEAMGWPCETVIAAIREPSDFAGLPVIDRGEPARGRVVFAPPRWAERLAVAGRGLLFLDEISTAPPAVQAALLRVVLERTVGDLALPADVAVVAAANPPEQAADGWDLSAPLANRFCHLDWPVDSRAVRDGFVRGFTTPAPPPLAPGWHDAIPAQRAVVAAFLTARPTLTCAVPDNAAQSGRGWPSPRSWDMAARLMAACRNAGPPRPSGDVEAALVEGAVGEGAGSEFLVWLVEADLPDPEAVLADPSSFTLPDRPDRALAALSAVTAAVIARPTVDRWLRGWEVVGKAAGTAADIAAVSARDLAEFRPAGAPVPPEVRTFAPLLRAAGLLDGDGDPHPDR
ncbi:MAG: AAA family ATPase [Acidimicrobiales bacterium]